MHSSDENLGGRDLDWVIFEKLNEEFIGKGGCNLKEKKKMRFNMLNAIERARKALSCDTDATITIDVFWEGEDYDRQITIDEFQKMIEPNTNQLDELLQKTLSNLENEHCIDVNKITVVELLGDTSRTPRF